MFFYPTDVQCTVNIIVFGQTCADDDVIVEHACMYDVNISNLPFLVPIPKPNTFFADSNTTQTRGFKIRTSVKL